MLLATDLSTRNTEIESSCILVHGNFFAQGGLSEFSLEDQEQGDSSDCERSMKLHDPLGHPSYPIPRSANVALVPGLKQC
jgi:hypothetical protein